MGKNRSNAQKHLQEQEDEEEKNKKVHVAHYKDYAACVQLLHPEPSSSHKAGNIAYDVERNQGGCVSAFRLAIIARRSSSSVLEAPVNIHHQAQQW
ncbi:unnamed protein product [Sphagnum jensenii]|uniref:Uncharacterized protein n=1 Tax=Sphagnum jensenii TaxID=128206 RepID=A0ABP0X9H8_9BRYO